jgi:hypothetical protein
MAIQALKLIQAWEEADAKNAEVRSFGQKMQVELERNGDVNSTIVFNGSVYAVIDMMIALADGVKITKGVGKDGPYTEVEFKEGAVQAAGQAASSPKTSELGLLGLLLLQTEA